MPGFDDRLTRELERVARPAAPDQGALFDDVTRRRAKWRARRRAGQVALVAVVLAGTAGGYIGLQRAFEGPGQPAATPTAPPGSVAPTPSAEPSPSAEPTPEPSVGRDLGLGFTVCVIARLDGVQFQEGATGNAWTAARVIDGKCADFGYEPDADPLVIVDVDGDGVADAFTKMPCEHGCDPSPVDSTDLNGDGRNELIVNMQPFSVMSYMLFVLTDDGSLVVARAGGDGPSASGFTAGRPAVFAGGGDEGYASSVSCANWPGPGTQITQTDTYRPIDVPEKGTQVSVTTVLLVGTTFEILGSDSYELAPDVKFDGHSNTPACGFDWNPWL